MSHGHFALEAEEEYLESLYEFWEDDNSGIVRTSSLAEALGVRQATVTGMVQRLAAKGLVDYEAYKGVTLTADGMRIGKTMKRRHRLLECLLIDVMGFRGDAHEAACRMEHAIDDELEVTLDVLLGHPSHDPSGRPIPASTIDGPVEFERGRIEVKILGAMESGSSGVICAVLAGRSSPALASIGLRVGADVVHTDEGFTLQGERLLIDDGLAHRVLVRLD